MGLKRKWYFDTVEWDKVIAEEGIQVDPDDLNSMNNTEMVEILNLLGIRAHRGLSRERLQELMMRGEDRKIDNPVDRYRNQIMQFFQQNWNTVKDQLELHCLRVRGNCMAHHDMEVLVCYATSEDVLTTR